MKGRIRLIRKNADLTQREFADKLNISRSQIASIENGKSAVHTRTINDICREFKVNKLWLETGDGEIYQEEFELDKLGCLLAAAIVENNELRLKLLEFVLEMDNQELKLFEKLINYLK